MVLGCCLRKARATKMRRPRWPGKLQKSSKCRSAWKSTCTPAPRANNRVETTAPRIVLRAQPWGRGRFDGSSNLFRIKEIKIGTAIRKFGEVIRRGLAFGRTKGGFDGVDRIKI